MFNYERQISLGELCWNILFHWRSLLLGAISGAVLIGGMVYLRDMKTYNQNTKKAEQQEHSFNFTEEENNLIQSAITTQNMISELKMYQQNSILLNMSSGYKQTLKLEYYVNTNYMEGEKDYSLSLAAAYTNGITNGTLSEKIIDELDLNLETAYITELISANYDQNALITIEILYPDKVILEKISEILNDWIAKQTETFTQQISEHTIGLLNKNIYIAPDFDLLNRQQEYQLKLNDFEQILADLKAQMSEEQLSAFDQYYVSLGVIDETEKKELLPPPQISLKYTTLGAIGVILLFVIWYACFGILSGKLQYTAELSDMYHLPMLGILQSKTLKGIDRLLLNIKTYGQKRLSNEQWMHIITSKIELLCQQKQVNEIYLTGSNLFIINKSFISALQKELYEKKIKLFYGDNICYDMSSLHDVIKINRVILIEQIGISTHQELKCELKTIAEKDVQIIGCIAVE